MSGCSPMSAGYSSRGGDTTTPFVSYEGFLAVHPDDAMAHLTLAFPIIANGQAPEAISDLEKDGGHDAS
jgi:hypothetical protein